MKKVIRIAATPATILACCLMTGCASFSKHRLPETGQLPPPADATQALKAGYQFTSGAKLGNRRQEHPQNIRELLEKEFVDALKESGYFASLTPSQSGGISINADMLNYGSAVAAGIGGVIGGLSLCTIPCWATDNFKVTVKVTASDGKQKEYVLDDAMTTVIWLPMIVATPFKDPNKVSTDVRKNIYRNLIRKMQQDGLLPAAKKSDETSRLQLTFKVDSAA